jgi:iron complex outermembrane receptor protein
MKIHRRTALAVSVSAALAAPPHALAEHGTDPGPVKTLGSVSVTGSRPTSLPSHIPTTIEGTTGKQVEETVNASDAEDALKYLPSLLVRKRYIGDYDHAVLATRASGTGNSARSLVFADGILLSNLLGNGAGFTPRWGLVTPEEIERVDVLYGPFSAAYSGNSVGAVVDYITRMPTQFEAHAKVAGFMQKFDLYRTQDTYYGHQESASLGSRNGKFSWWFNANHLDSDAHPITFATKVVATGTAGTAGTPVTGAVFGQNPRNQDQWLVGAGTVTSTKQDHAKLKLAYDFTPTLRASYTFGVWRNDAFRDSQPFLLDAAGNPVYSGNVNIEGRQFSIAPTEISQSRADMQHLIHGLAVKTHTRGAFDWEVLASIYDYDRDQVRSPLVARPVAENGGAGRIADQQGTGWRSLWMKGAWRPSGAEGTHLVDFGVQYDRHELRTRVSDTGDWISGGAGARFSEFGGMTELTSLYAQDTLRLGSAWRATLGLRWEQWRASDGSLANATTVLGFPERDESRYSPKAAIAYQATPDWVLRASLGRAIRNPTVSELYQGTISTGTIVNNDPNLKPERSWTSEVTAERDVGSSNLRATFFYEDTRDALYSQTNVTVFPNVTSIQNVDHIRTRGLEVAWSAAEVFVRGLELQSSATFADSKILENAKFPASVGEWQPRVPRWRANLLATYRANERWSGTFGVRYSGRQYNTLDNSDPNGFAYTGTSKFLVADVRVRYRFDRQWVASLGIDNLNNYEYWNFHPYPQRTFIGELQWNY